MQLPDVGDAAIPIAESLATPADIPTTGDGLKRLDVAIG